MKDPDPPAIVPVVVVPSPQLMLADRAAAVSVVRASVKLATATPERATFWAGEDASAPLTASCVTQVLPTSVNPETQVQLAMPEFPVQVWLVMGQGAAVPYERQPLLPSEHTSISVETHDFCPELQLLVQVKAHMALGALPEQDSGAEHIVVVDTKGHVFMSTSQVAMVWVFSQTEPAAVQTEGLQRQVATPPLTVHVWWGPQFMVGTHAVQPLACVWQVCTPLVPHSVVPAVHAFVQHVALPAAPVHAPPVHCVVPDWKMHPCESFAQVTSVWAFSQEGPTTPLQAATVLHVQFALPAEPVQLSFALWHGPGVP